MVVHDHDGEVARVAIGGEQGIAVVEERQVAAEEHRTLTVKRSAECSRDGAIDAIGAAVTKDFGARAGWVVEPLEVTYRHTAADEESIIGPEGFFEQRHDTSFKVPVDTGDAFEFRAGGLLRFGPSREPSVVGRLRMFTARGERAVEACPPSVCRIDVLTGAVHL